MAQTTSASVTAEPAPASTAVTSDKTESHSDSTSTDKSDNVVVANNKSSTPDKAGSKMNGDNHETSGSAKASRPPLQLTEETEMHVRQVMMNARKVANGEDNPFQTVKDVKDLTLVANGLVQLLNAAYIATDTVVRGVGYLQDETRPHGKTALGYARRDRRAQLSQQRAEQGLTNATNHAVEPTNLKEESKATTDTAVKETGDNDDSNKENTAPVSDGSPQNGTTVGKSSKKKRYWNNRRNRKVSGNRKIQPQGTTGYIQNDGATDVKDTAHNEGKVMVHNSEKSGSDTAVEGGEETATAPVSVTA